MIASRMDKHGPAPSICPPSTIRTLPTDPKRKRSTSLCVDQDADLRARVLRGTKPSYLPFEQSAGFRFLINRRLAGSRDGFLMPVGRRIGAQDRRLKASEEGTGGKASAGYGI